MDARPALSVNRHARSIGPLVLPQDDVPAAHPPLRSPPVMPDAPRRSGTDELVYTFGDMDRAALSVAIPTYRDDPTPLIRALSACLRAEAVAIAVYDDGSVDETMTLSIMAALGAHPGPARLVSAVRNRGRSTARNRLIGEATSDWIAFVDADMRPDSRRFLVRYLNAIDKAERPAVIAGGFSLSQTVPTAQTALHAAQSARSECLPAFERNTAAGRYVFSSNVLVHRDILKAVPFDDGYTGWGWEDVDWGLRVEAHFPVRHVDNPASHLGLDTDEALVRKYAGSGTNFARLVNTHPDAARAMALYRAARRLKAAGPLRPLISAAARSAALSRRLPIGWRLAGLKLFRAARYGGAL